MKQNELLTKYFLTVLNDEQNRENFLQYFYKYCKKAPERDLAYFVFEKVLFLARWTKAQGTDTLQTVTVERQKDTCGDFYNWYTYKTQQDVQFGLQLFENEQHTLADVLDTYSRN